MSNLLLFPIIIPLFFATVLMIFPKRLKLQRFLAATGAAATLIAALVLLAKVNAEGVQAVTLGSWPAPFGISMVSDPLSALLVVTTSIITLFVVFYSFPTIGVKREQSFYFLDVIFIMVGDNCAFTSGVIFNLLEFIELLLMASSTLNVHGGEKPQQRESLK